MSFKIKSSNNSLKSHKTFASIDEFMQFYHEVLMDEVSLYHIPLKISTQQVSDVIQDLIFQFRLIIEMLKSQKLY